MSTQVDSHNPEIVDAQEFIAFLDYEFTGNDYTVERKRAFLQVYHRKGTITHAAFATGLSRKTVYNWIDTDPQFAEALDDAKVQTKETMETSVYESALAGDSILKMFWLKAHDPKYRDRMTVDIEAVDREIDDHLKRRQLPAPSTDYIDTSVIGDTYSAIPAPPQFEQKKNTGE